jgi:deoxyribodipyrimidine photolyase-related protein
MSQYADGGLVASKPYVASANYISKMSNYCKTCLYNKNSRTDSNSCPFNALYWNFFIKNQNKLQSNPRIGMVYMNIKKMTVPETEAIKKT